MALITATRVGGHHLKARSSGFSLIEVMIGSMLGLVVIAGAVILLTDGFQGSRFRDQVRQIQESGRAALDVIARDLRLAGYTGIITDLSQVDFSPLESHDTGCGGQGWFSDLSRPVIAYQGHNPFNNDCIPTANFNAGTDMLVVRRVSENPVTESAAIKNRLYLFGSPHTGTAFAAENDGAIPSSVVESKLSSDAFLLYPLVAHIYHVRPCEDTSKGKPGICDGMDDHVPVLVRERAGLAHPVAEPLVAGIEGLEILAGVDHSNPRDYEVNNYSPPGKVDNWERVVSIRISVQVRSFERVFRPPATLGAFPGDTEENILDGYIRKTFSQTVFLENAALRVSKHPDTPRPGLLGNA